METNTAFVGADSVVVLHTISVVNLHVALVVHPCYAELDHAIGNAEALYEIGFLKFGVLVIHFLNSGENLRNGLNVFGLTRIAAFQIFDYFV